MASLKTYGVKVERLLEPEQAPEVDLEATNLGILQSVHERCVPGRRSLSRVDVIVELRNLETIEVFLTYSDTTMNKLYSVFKVS